MNFLFRALLFVQFFKHSLNISQLLAHQVLLATISLAAAFPVADDDSEEIEEIVVEIDESEEDPTEDVSAIGRRIITTARSVSQEEEINKNDVIAELPAAVAVNWGLAVVDGAIIKHVLEVEENDVGISFEEVNSFQKEFGRRVGKNRKGSFFGSNSVEVRPTGRKISDIDPENSIRLPAVQRTTSAPQVIRTVPTTTEAATTRATTAAPVVVTSTTAAPVAVTTAAPVVVTSTTVAPVAVTTAAPVVVTSTTAAPVVFTSTTAAPVTTTAPTAAPATFDDESEDEEEEILALSTTTAPEPLKIRTTTAPRVFKTETTAAPVVTTTTAPPTTAPVTTAPTAAPVKITTTVAPVAETTAAPTTAAAPVAPVATPVAPVTTLQPQTISIASRNRQKISFAAPVSTTTSASEEDVTPSRFAAPGRSVAPFQRIKPGRRPSFIFGTVNSKKERIRTSTESAEITETAASIEVATKISKKRPNNRRRPVTTTTTTTTTSTEAVAVSTESASAESTTAEVAKKLVVGKRPLVSLAKTTTTEEPSTTTTAAPSTEALPESTSAEVASTETVSSEAPSTEAPSTEASAPTTVSSTSKLFGKRPAFPLRSASTTTTSTTTVAPETEKPVETQNRSPLNRLAPGRRVGTDRFRLASTSTTAKLPAEEPSTTSTVSARPIR